MFKIMLKASVIWKELGVCTESTDLWIIDQGYSPEVIVTLRLWPSFLATMTASRHAMEPQDSAL